MYFIMLILKKSVLLLQPLLLQIIKEEVELLLAGSIVSLALSLHLSIQVNFHFCQDIVLG